MRTNFLLRGLGIVAVGAGLALGAGHGIAAAEPDAGSAESKTAESSSQASTAPAETKVTETVGGQRDSSEDKAPAKPTSTVSAATVSVHADDEREGAAEVVVEPEVTVKPAKPSEKVDEKTGDMAEAAPTKVAKHAEAATPATRQVEKVPEKAFEKSFEKDTETAVATPTGNAEPEVSAAAAVTPKVLPSAAASPAAEPAEPTVRLVSAALTPAMAPPPPPNIVNVIGTLLFAIVTLPLRLFEQAPVVPAGYSVTVGRSTLDIGCGCGQSVDARWYFPDTEAHGGQAPQSVVFLQHGFIRSNSAMSAMAIELAQRTNSIVVTPTLTSNPFTSDGCWINGEPMQRAVADLFVGDRAALTQSAVAAGWTGGALPADFVLAGHSAGGGLAAAAAGFTTENGASSDLLLVLMLDGVPTGNALPAALDKLTGADARQVLQIASPPYVWNSNGLGVDQLTAARPGQFVGVQLVGGSHVDYEGASSDILAQLACGFSRPENVRAAQDLAVSWIDDAIARTAITAPGGAGQTVSLPTVAGTATAVVLGGVQAASSDRAPSRV